MEVDEFEFFFLAMRSRDLIVWFCEFEFQVAAISGGILICVN